MVSRITNPVNISRALNYNEQKVNKGKAVCLHAANFLKDLHQLTCEDKLRRFENLIALNGRATTNTIHISLNFDPSEKLDEEKLKAIACGYMNKIGFGDQPYLVYQHLDAGHPHLHVVTTNIQSNGKRIDTFNMGRVQSQQAIKEIELTFGLLKTNREGKTGKVSHKTEDVPRVIYGKSETKRGITEAVHAVVDHYKYTNLEELNSVLRLYNVTADRGTKESITYQKRGLVYRVLDEKGGKIGVPVKASSIDTKPTLNYLEKKFAENEVKRQINAVRVKTAIDWSIIHHTHETFSSLTKHLGKEGIDTDIQRNEKGIVQDIIYIDHRTKAVFKGSDLGEKYSAEGLLSRITQMESLGQNVDKENAVELPPTTGQDKDIGLEQEKDQSSKKTLTGRALFQELLKAQRASTNISESELLKKKNNQKRNLNL